MIEPAPVSEPPAGDPPKAPPFSPRLRALVVAGALVIVSALALARYDASRTIRHGQATAQISADGSPGENVARTIAALRQRVTSNPDDISARVRLAALLDSQGDSSEGEDVLRAALQRGHKKPEVFHALGMLYLHNEQYTAAVYAFEAEIKLAPDSFPARLNLAQSYAYLQQGEKAQKQFEHARELDPSHPDVYLGLAFLNNREERYPYAVQYLKQYIKRAEQPGPGYALLSRVYVNMRQYEKAVEAGKTASVAMPDNAYVWYNLGQAYLYRPTPSLNEAAHSFEQAVKQSPDWGQARGELAYVYSRQNRLADATAQYREAVRHEPMNGRYHYQLGRLLVQQGAKEEAQRALARSQELVALNQRERMLQDKIVVAPREPRHLFQLAQVYRQMGKISDAQKWYRATLEVDPAYPEAQEQLDELRRLAAQSPRPQQQP